MSSSNHQTTSNKNASHSTNVTTRASAAASKHSHYMFPHASTKASSSMISDFGKFNQHFAAGNNRQAIVTREGARSSGHVSSTFGNSREQRTTPTGATKMGEYRRVAYNPHVHQGSSGTNQNTITMNGASNASIKHSYVNSSQSHKSTRDTHASQSSANAVQAFKDNHHVEESHQVPQPENLADKLASTAANSVAHKHTNQGVFKPKIMQSRVAGSQSSAAVSKINTVNQHQDAEGHTTGVGRSHSSNTTNGSKLHHHQATSSVNQTTTTGAASGSNSIKHIEPVRRRMVNITGPLSATNGQMTNGRRVPGDLRKITQRVNQSRQNDENDGNVSNSTNMIQRSSGAIGNGGSAVSSSLNQQKNINRILSSKPIGASNQNKSQRNENSMIYGQSRPTSGHHQKLTSQHNGAHYADKENTKNHGNLYKNSVNNESTIHGKTSSQQQQNSHQSSNTFKRSKTSEHMRYPIKQQKDNQKSESNISHQQGINAVKKQTVAPQTKQPLQNQPTTSTQDKVLQQQPQQHDQPQKPVTSQPTITTDRAKQTSRKAGDFSQAKYQEIKELMAKRTKERTKALSRQLEVCDLLDMRNVQTVAEFVPQITDNLLKEELTCMLPDDFMQNQNEVTPQMRSFLVDWLADLHHKFKLWPETLYVTIGTIDRFLAVMPNFKKRDLQCLGVTALHIAGKYEEIYPPELKTIIKITGNAVTKQQVIEMEFQILMKLDFCIQFPSALRFAERFGRLAQLNEKQGLLVQYLCDVSLLDCNFLKQRPSFIACLAIYATQFVFKGPKQNGLWNSILAKNSGYKEAQIKELALELLSFCKSLHQTKNESLRKKYSHQRNQEVAKLLVNVAI